MKFVLMITKVDPHWKYDSITSSTIHEKLPDYDPAGSIHAGNVHIKTNDKQ
jgi:hypothetical protein